MFNLEKKVISYCIYIEQVFKYMKVILKGKETMHAKYLLPASKKVTGLEEDKGDLN